MPYTLDDSRWPHAVLAVIDSLTSDEEDSFAERSSALSTRGERYTAIVNLLESDTPTSRFLRVQAAAMKRHKATLAEQCAGVAFVIDSAMMRGALRAVLHLQPLPCPYTVVKHLDQAEAWVAEALAAS